MDVYNCSFILRFLAQMRTFSVQQICTFLSELKQQQPTCTLLPENKQTITDVCHATSQIARTADMFLSSRDKAAAK
jgi:hypothetical protein